jgi:hypothetical protein
METKKRVRDGLLTRVLLVIFVFLCIYVLCTRSASAECEWNEKWEPVIQLDYRADADHLIYSWKAKKGRCVDGSPVFSSSRYYTYRPSKGQLESYFKFSLHEVGQVSGKSRWIYVNESAWKESRNGTIVATNFLMMVAAKNVLVIMCPWTPDNSSPDSEGETVLEVLPNNWQNVYITGDWYVQIKVYLDEDGVTKLAKAKFGEVRDNVKSGKHIVFFYVKRGISVVPGWTPGIAPFDLAKDLPDYSFFEEFNPDDETDIWAAGVSLKNELPSECQ